MRISGLLYAGCMAALAPTGTMTAAHAQQSDVTMETAGHGEVHVLEMITVTARKVEEDLNDVPLAITVVDELELQDAHIENSQDLSRWVPNFNFTDSGLSFANMLNIRGIGSSSALIGPSVNYYVDGVPVPVRVFDQRFLDVAQIEVLRGPQGTLFGLNSLAGVVNITTMDPADSFGAELGVEFGSYGHSQVSAMVEGPLSDTVSGRLSGEFYGFDGDIRNYTFDATQQVISDDREIREERLGALSGKIVITPDAGTKVTFSGHYRHDDQQPTTGVLLDDQDFPRNAFNPVPEETIETTGLGMTAEHDLGWANLTSVSGLQHYRIDLEADIVDGFIGSAQTGLPPFGFQGSGLNVRRIEERNTQFTQELRLDGETEQGTLWVAGVSGLFAQFESTTDITSVALANGAYAADQKTTNVAAFGEVTLPVTEKLRWIGGLRLTFERQDFDGLFVGDNGAMPRFEDGGRNDYAFVTGRTGLSYDISETLTAFATVARGEKAGAFPIYNQFASLGIPSAPYGQTSTWSYEVGVRGQPLTDWLDVSASLFFNDTADAQLFSFNPLAGRFSVQNADTQTYGAELEVKAQPTEHWFLAANFALLHAEITGGDNSGLIGNDIPYAPSLAVGLAAEYRRPFAIGSAEGSAFGRIEYQHLGSRQIDPGNSRSLDPYSLVNLRAGWQGERFDIYGSVENLFDESYVLSAYQVGTGTAGEPVLAGVPGQPRTFYLGARWRF